MSKSIQEAIAALEELNGDASLPKNVKQKLIKILTGLKGKTISNLEVSKALHEIEEITEDTNLQSYTRMQLFNVVSLLEAA
ncbi:UPF0147 family protein [Candidatus Woesearchaeota archaeon]|nr:UPF0147 family protein [Candidatus Woesearchaeota archaeon]